MSQFERLRGILEKRFSLSKVITVRYFTNNNNTLTVLPYDNEFIWYPIVLAKWSKCATGEINTSDLFLSLYYTSHVYITRRVIRTQRSFDSASTHNISHAPMGVCFDFSAHERGETRTPIKAVSARLAWHRAAWFSATDMIQSGIANDCRSSILRVNKAVDYIHCRGLTSH